MLLRKLFRTAWRYKAQFFSMIVMIAIGTGVFLGFNIEWYTLQKNTSDFFEQTRFADYRIYDEQGFSEEDIAAVRGIEGVEEASRIFTVNVAVKDSDASLGLFVCEDYTVSTMTLIEGAEYDASSDGMWLSDKYAYAHGISLGDEMTMVYRNIAISGEVVGLVKSSEFLICVADENQLMPDYSSYGFIYTTPKKLKDTLGFSFYPQINILSDMEKTQMEQEIARVLGKTTLVLSKSESYSYAGAQSEVEEGQSMGAILPVLFLLIGILTMITTMHRITTNEKQQIGTLKALGFKRRRILRHYTSYGFFIGLIGSLIGIGLGFAIAYFIVNPNGMQGTYMDMPSWTLSVPWFCWIVLALTVGFLTLIGFLSVRKMLAGSAADTLRPYTPKRMKAMAIEKSGIWQKLSFDTKWNLRDILRHKSRSSMTLIGILGCMLLLVGGLGMKDTMTEYLTSIDSQILNYQTRVNIVEDASNDAVWSFADTYDGDLLSSTSVSLNGEAVALEIYHVTHDKIRFIDKSNRTVSLKDDGVYICLRLAKTIRVGDTIEFSPYGSDQTYSAVVAGTIRSVLSENITMTQAYADSIGIPYRYSAVFTDTPQSSIAQESFISGMQTKQALMESYDSFMEIMDIMVLIFILAAVVLGIVVLYNLGIMSYVERYRELATLKVVGFKNRNIGRILIRQNLWLTIAGVCIGLPAGVGVLQLLITMLADEYELKLALGPLTYCISILITFGVSLLVGFIIAGKNRKIDMVEALKSE